MLINAQTLVDFALKEQSPSKDLTATRMKSFAEAGALKTWNKSILLDCCAVRVLLMLVLMDASFVGAKALTALVQTAQLL
jgi:hypothetical protein